MDLLLKLRECDAQSVGDLATEFGRHLEQTFASRWRRQGGNQDMRARSAL
jgi:hypothetical protein